MSEVISYMSEVKTNIYFIKYKMTQLKINNALNVDTFARFRCKEIFQVIQENYVDDSYARGWQEEIYKISFDIIKNCVVLYDWVKLNNINKSYQQTYLFESKKIWYIVDVSRDCMLGNTYECMKIKKKTYKSIHCIGFEICIVLRKDNTLGLYGFRNEMRWLTSWGGTGLQGEEYVKYYKEIQENVYNINKIEFGSLNTSIWTTNTIIIVCLSTNKIKKIRHFNINLLDKSKKRIFSDLVVVCPK